MTSASARRLLMVAALAVMLSGCGSAMLAQARAATVATIALEGARRVTLEAADRDAAACADEPCVLEAAARLRPVVAAYEGLRVTLAAWVSALDVARLAGAGDELVPIMLTAGQRFVDDWRRLSTALRLLGVDLPTPDMLLAYLGAP